MMKKSSVLRFAILALFCAIGFWGALAGGCSVSPSSSAIGSYAFSARQQQILEALADANVVYLGENHDDAKHHRAEFAILQALHRENSKLALALEMFQRPFQKELDRYLQGEIDEAELIERTEYEERWGFDWEFYAPLLRYARDRGLPVFAANTPREITRKVARGGFESLAAEDWRWIPPREEIDMSNEAYRAILQSFFASFHHASGESEGFERFFAAQVLWDETMAETIARLARDRPDYQILAIAGAGHVACGYGIPDRVARRLQDLPNFSQRSVLFEPLEDFPCEGETAIAEDIWFSEAGEGARRKGIKPIDAGFDTLAAMQAPGGHLFEENHTDA